MGYKPTKKNASKTFPIYKAKGCKECIDVGYRGRIGIYEILVMDNELREAVIKHASLDDFKKIANKKGMKDLRQAALQKVIDGKTSIEEVMRVT